MRKQLITTVVVILLVMAVVGAVVGGDLMSPRAVQPAPAPGTARNVPASTLLLAREALAGSIPAAERMMGLYRCTEMDFRTDAEKKGCYGAYDYWADVALQNGSPVAAQSHSNLLLNSGACEDVYRAEFWLPRFKDAFPGHPDLMKNMGAEIQEKKRSCEWSRTPATQGPVH